MVKKNVTTVELSGLTKVQFDKEYNYFFVNNLSGGDVLMSTDLIVEGADGVITIPDGASYGTMHGYATDTVYVKGNGKVQVMGTYSAFNPFKSAVKGGEIKTAVGTNISLKNSVEFPLLGLNFYGRSWQNGVPSLSNTVPIESIGDSGSLTVTTCGKNLYEGSQDWSGEWQNTNYWSDSEETYNGLKVKKRKGAYGGIYKILYAEAGKTYTFSSYVKADTEAIMLVFPNRPFGDGSHVDGAAEPLHVTNQGTLIGTEWTRVSCQFVCTKSGFINPRLEGSTNDATYYICGYQFEESPEMTDYESYKSTAATITTSLPLRGIPVSNNGNYTDGNGQQWVCDMLIYGSVNGKIVKYIGTETFDGSADERWGLSGSNKRINSDKLSGVAKASESSSIVMPCLCDRLTARSGAETYNGTEGIAFDASANVCIAFSVLADNSDVSVWKDYLAANPVTVVYQLAVPVEIEITEEEAKALLSLRTFDSVTNIYNSENADMSVEYLTSKAVSKAVMPIITALRGDNNA